MVLVTLLAAAFFALGIFFFAKPGEIREALEPISTSSYRPIPPSSAPIPNPAPESEVEQGIQQLNDNQPTLEDPNVIQDQKVDEQPRDLSESEELDQVDEQISTQ